MKNYTIEIHSYPQEFIIAAATEGEARLEAQRRWHEKMSGMSIYETKVTGEEPLD